MENFKVIYKLLRYLEGSLDGEVDLERLKGEAYGISEERFRKVILMLLESGYIKGVSIRNYTDGEMMMDLKNIEITLLGLEYLEDNSMMRKAYRAIKGIKDIIP